MEQSVAELTCRMAEGDSQAFDRIMEHYCPKVLHMAYLISGSYTDSEDTVQETFVLCQTNRGKIKDPESFGNQIYRTLTREAWRFCKKHRKGRSVEVVYGREEPQSGSVPKEVIKRSRDQGPYRVVKNLPVKQGTAVVLYYFNRMPARKIARIMGCLEGTVESRLYTARKNLKKGLAKEQDIGREVAL